MLDKPVVLIGYSGHGYVVGDAAILSGLNLKYYCDKWKSDENPLSLDYLGYEGSVEFKGWSSDFDYILGIGDNKIRRKSWELINAHNFKVLNVIHPSSVISSRISIGDGNFISGNVSINAMTTIENHCILNTGCIIEHDCTVKNGAHIAPGAVLAGGVSVGENSFIGANAVVRQGVKIGDDVIIGAGAVILNDIPSNSIYVGNPGKKLN